MAVPHGDILRHEEQCPEPKQCNGAKLQARGRFLQMHEELAPQGDEEASRTIAEFKSTRPVAATPRRPPAARFP